MSQSGAGGVVPDIGVPVGSRYEWHGIQLQWNRTASGYCYDKSRRNSITACQRAAFDVSSQCVFLWFLVGVDVDNADIEAESRIRFYEITEIRLSVGHSIRTNDFRTVAHM